MIGKTLSHYRIVGELGRGGMGVVYEAEDLKLRRRVAIKVLPERLTAEPAVRKRFLREARIAAQLSHPNIATVHEIDDDEGTVFIVMEMVRGETLRSMLRVGTRPVLETLDLAIGVAEALAYAHQQRIIHRDLKPENVVVESGRPRILDFGLSKLLEKTPLGATDDDAETGIGEESPTESVELTGHGAILGTVAYMSPEQAQGKPVDARSDVFSFGTVLYEMLSGRKPFAGDSQLTILAAILTAAPPPVRDARGDVPGELESIVARCLEKDPAARYASAVELSEALRRARTRLLRPRTGPMSALRRPVVLVPVLLVLATLLFAGGWLWSRANKTRWARNVALPEITQLAERQQFVAALELAREAERYIAGDPQLEYLIASISLNGIVTTTPPGATVSIKAYRDPGATWQHLGTTPLDGIRVPDGFLRLRFEKQGFATVLLSAHLLWGLSCELHPEDTVPDGMVHIPGGSERIGQNPPQAVPAFWMDRHEVTNAEFQEFVDAGGYENPDHWPQPIQQGDRILSWDEAMALFRDTTGRAGPATWALGHYPEGAAELPVSGISWYEAAAYATWAGKQLPSVFHWYRAANMSTWSEILTQSNIGRTATGPVAVGSLAGLGPYGTFDMAGNVREWCWNATDERRYILGGAWSDPNYLYRDTNAITPLDRSPQNGMRCMRAMEPLDETLLRSVDASDYDFAKVTPVDDATFAVYRSMYAYDPSDLDARVESVDEDLPHWRRETVSFRAAYGDARVPAHLLLPRNAKPPYQIVLFAPHSGAREFTSSRDLEIGTFVSFIPRTGRAIILPIFPGTYERGGGAPPPEGYARREQFIHWSKDIQRTIDYLETRDDIDTSKLAFYGVSLGAEMGPIFTAIEDRFRVSVLLAGHLHAHQMDDPPEIQPLHFAPRSTVPVLLINGRDDFGAPVDTALRPMLELQGAPDEHKRLLLLDGGHVPPMNAVMSAILDWLDRYLGPVDRGDLP